MMIMITITQQQQNNKYDNNNDNSINNKSNGLSRKAPSPPSLLGATLVLDAPHRPCCTGVNILQYSSLTRGFYSWLSHGRALGMSLRAVSFFFFSYVWFIPVSSVIVRLSIFFFPFSSLDFFFFTFSLPVSFAFFNHFVFVWFICFSLHIRFLYLFASIFFPLRFVSIIYSSVFSFWFPCHFLMACTLFVSFPSVLMTFLPLFVFSFSLDLIALFSSF